MLTKHDRYLNAVFLFLGGALSIPPLLLLPKTGWPASVQGMEAEQALALFTANEVSFRSGYLMAALSGLFFFLGTLFLARVARHSAQESYLSAPLLGLAIAAGSLRSLWYFWMLTGVPLMADLWTSLGESSHAAINIVYLVLNDLLSTVQEDVGVNLLGGLFWVFFGLTCFQYKTYSWWTATLAVIAGTSLIFSSSEFLGFSNGKIIPFIGPTVSGVLVMCIALVEVMQARRRPPLSGS